ncbi:DUF4099 domain-containing protein [Parabacteroides faecis]|nr:MULTISPECIES: DUF4099 domain-containing protein [Parabacteroides]GGK18933.1 hypothetical protein GCM10007084_47760 [Parabacteroides faecis]
MDEKLKNDAKKIMLVQQAGDGPLKAVTDINKKGKIKVTDPTEQNIANLFNVNTHDSALEAFFKKFVQEADNPSHTGVKNAVTKVFIMTEDVLNKLIKINFDPNELEKYRVDPAAELQKMQDKGQTQGKTDDKAQEQSGGNGETTQTVQPYDTSKIDRADLERKGIKWESIEPHLRAMSYGHKSNKLIEMNPEMEPGGIRVPTKGRVSLAEQPDGSLRVVPHYWQEKPNLNVPFHGVMLPEDVKTNIENTRHAGKIVDLELTPGKKEACYISRDELTNTLEYMRVADFPHKKDMKGTTLSDGTEMNIAGGSKGLLEKFVTRAGYYRDGYIQVDAANRNYEFSYDGLDRNRYAQENKEIYRQNLPEKKGEQKEASQEKKQLDTFIHKSMGGVAVPKDVYDVWKAAEVDPSKRAEVKAVYMKDMKLDGKGQPVSLWVKPNYELGKQQFFKWNPDYVRKTATKVKPTVESEKQHAVNTEGKTVEATKKVKEPLKPGQQQPTETQKKKQDENKPQVRQRPPAKGQSTGKKNTSRKVS